MTTDLAQAEVLAHTIEQRIAAASVADSRGERLRQIERARVLALRLVIILDAAVGADHRDTSRPDRHATEPDTAGNGGGGRSGLTPLPPRVSLAAPDGKDA